MKRNQQIPILIATALLSLNTWCATSALGAPSLAAIPLLGSDTSNEARAITPDGVFVVGLSGTTAGFLYNATNGYLVQPLNLYGYSAQIAAGVGYRTATDPYNPPNTRTELVLSGLGGFALPYYHTVFMTTDGGTNWDYGVQIYAGKKPTVPVANGLAGSTGEVFYATWTDQGPASGDDWGLFVCEYSGPWYPATVAYDTKNVPKPNSLTQMNGIASKGRAVGWRLNSGDYINYIVDYNGPSTTGAIWSSAGLDGSISGQAYSVSADGTVIFGISPKGVATGITNFGYKAVFDTNFPGTATQLSTAQLPNFPDVTGSPTNATGTVNLAVPYGCTPDGKLAVGMNYRGIEKAVFWNTSDADTNKWTVTDLTDLAQANGILGEFTRLSRAYSIGTNTLGEKVVVGVGVDTNSPANTRAFVMKFTAIPPALAPARITSILPGSGVCTINYTGGAGSQFVILGSSLVSAPMSGWTRIATNYTGSGSFVVGTGGSPKFWRIKSE